MDLFCKSGGLILQLVKVNFLFSSYLIPISKYAELQFEQVVVFIKLQLQIVFKGVAREKFREGKV